MKPTLIIPTALLVASQSAARAADELVVYPPVPGLAASEHYNVRMRPASDGGKWQNVFAWETVCKAGKPVLDMKFFKTNEFVDRIIFAPGAVPKP